MSTVKNQRVKSYNTTPDTIFKAIKLRQEKLPYREIGKRLNISTNKAFIIVKKAMDEYREKYLEIAADIVEMEKANLDKLENILHEKMKTSDQNDRTILSIIRIQERRSKLLGLDAPVKTFVEMNVPEPIQFVIEG